MRHREVQAIFERGEQAARHCSSIHVCAYISALFTVCFTAVRVYHRRYCCRLSLSYSLSLSFSLISRAADNGQGAERTSIELYMSRTLYGTRSLSERVKKKRWKEKERRTPRKREKGFFACVVSCSRLMRSPCEQMVNDHSFCLALAR